MHGGGFVMGSVDDTESVIPGYELAARAGAVVVSVDYRLAVDGVRYPAPLDDVLAAWHWLADNAADLGVDPQRLFIGGASVGANLATGAAVRLRDAGDAVPRGMLLAYPLVHFPTPPNDPEVLAELDQVPPMLRFPEQYQLGIVHNYVGRVDDLPADVVPGNFPVDGLPEAWIAPERVRRPSPVGGAVREQLDEAGVPVHLELARGMVHGHLGRGPSLEPVDATLDFFADALRSPAPARADGPPLVPPRLPGEAAPRVPAPAPHPEPHLHDGRAAARRDRPLARAGAVRRHRPRGLPPHPTRHPVGQGLRLRVAARHAARCPTASRTRS